MFSLNSWKTKLINLNLRAELHGDKPVTAVDMTMETHVGNDVLNQFDPELKTSLYRKADDPQGELLTDAGHMTALRFVNLVQPMKWDAELEGYIATVHYGIGEESDITMTDCEVDSFKFDCKEGGSVAIKYRVIAHPSEEQIGKLSGMIATDIEFSLTPPEEQGEQQEDMPLAKAA
jgi:hypothetical protein